MRLSYSAIAPLRTTLAPPSTDYSMAHDDFYKRLGLFPDQYLKSIKAFQDSGSLSARLRLESALASLNSYQRACQEALASISTSETYQQSIKSMLLQSQAIEEAAKAFSRPAYFEKALESTRIADMAAAAMTRSSAVEGAMKAIEDQQELYRRALGSLTVQSSIASALSGIGRYQSETEAAVKRILESSSLLFENPEYLREIAESVSELELDEADSQNIEDEIGQAAHRLSSVKNAKSYVEWYKALPPYVQLFLWFLFLQVSIPQLNSISANLLTLKVQEVLEQENRSERDKINDIRSIRFGLNGIDTGGLRFITGTNVRLRSHPSTRADVLDELDLGQVVAVVSRERNWIEVRYEYEDGETKVGWVFARYTSKFKN